MNGMNTLLHFRATLRATAASLLFLIHALPVQADSPPIFLSQGANWTAADRDEYYSQDQGGRLIPLAWLKALKHLDGQPFLADNLSRYGYLANPASGSGLPVG